MISLISAGIGWWAVTRLALQERHGSTNAIENTLQIDIEGLVPDFVGDVLELAMRNAGAPTGIVNQDIEPAEFSSYAIDHRAHFGIL